MHTVSKPDGRCGRITIELIATTAAGSVDSYVLYESNINMLYEK